jgi:hypothetical protein
MNSPAPGPHKDDTPSLWSGIPGLETVEKQ